jgi:glycosyltransferase AglD
MKNYFKSTIKLGIAILIILGFILLTFRYFDAETIWKSTLKIIHHPIMLLSIFVIYFISFYFKAIAWKLYLRGRARLSTCLIGIFYSLLVNHLLPIKIGDLLRIKILSTRDKQITNDEAFHSVFILRLLDMLSLIIMTLIGLVSLKVKFIFPTWAIVFSLIICITIIFILNKYAPLFFNKHITLLKNALLNKNGLAIILLTLMSWILEAGVIYFTVMALSGGLSLFEAVFANSVTVAGQVFQITPGGIANYESFLVFACN